MIETRAELITQAQLICNDATSFKTWSRAYESLDVSSSVSDDEWNNIYDYFEKSYVEKEFTNIMKETRTLSVFKKEVQGIYDRLGVDPYPDLEAKYLDQLRKAQNTMVIPGVEQLILCVLPSIPKEEALFTVSKNTDPYELICLGQRSYVI